MQVIMLEPENELAICRHNRAIVEGEIRTSSLDDKESLKELNHLRAELTNRIQRLEFILNEKGKNQHR